jgi:hypothetical protein
VPEVVMRRLTQEVIDMTALNIALGVPGLILAGDSFGVSIRTRNLAVFAVGVIELMVGLFFVIAAIGSAS